MKYFSIKQFEMPLKRSEFPQRKPGVQWPDMNNPPTNVSYGENLPRTDSHFEEMM